MRVARHVRALIATSELDRLTDAFMDVYVRWREEASETEAAWELWQRCGCREAAMRCAAYGAALDREEAAARELRKCLIRLRGSLGS